MSETDDGHRFTFRFNSAIFERSTIARLMSQLERLLEGIIADPYLAVVEAILLVAPKGRYAIIAGSREERDLSGRGGRCIALGRALSREDPLLGAECLVEQ